MNRYEPTELRPVFAVSAVAMTALTLVLAIGVPAGLAPAGRDTTTMILAKGDATGFTEVTIIPSRIEVVGRSETNLAVQPQKPRS